MISLSTLILSVLFLTEISYGTDIAEREKDRLERNLKVLRRDFNKIIENVEEFTADFLKQIQEAGKLAGTAYYMGDNDYTWKDDESSSEEPSTQKNNPSAISSSTGPTNLKEANPSTTKHPPKFYYSLVKSTDDEDIENEIPTRKKRSVLQMAPNNIPVSRQSAPMHFIENPQGQIVPMAREVVQQRSPVPITNQERPMMRQNHQPPMVGQKQHEQGNILGAHQNTKHDQPNPENQKRPKEDLPVCSSKPQKEVDMEKQKMEELKAEVTKLNELVGLLKDQQKLIKVMGIEDMDNNEIDIDLNRDLLENPFLYKAIKQLETANKKDRMKSVDNTQSKPNINDQAQNRSFQEINNLKLNLKKTEKTLNETKEILIKEKDKEDILEDEVKRQNTELKFLKVMMEKLYDKNNLFPDAHNKAKAEKAVNEKSVRNSDLEDTDIDPVLGTVHMPKPWPMINKDEKTKWLDEQTRNSKMNKDLSTVQRFLKTLAPPQEGLGEKDFKIPTIQERSFENARDGEESSENSLRERLDKFFQQVHKQFGSKDNPFREFNERFEREFLANRTMSALIELTKHDPYRFRKFNIGTRDSKPNENPASNMHRLLSIISKEEKDGNIPIVQTNQNPEQNVQINSLNAGNKDNDTFLSKRLRASKMDDTDFKLKLIEMLSKEGRSDDTSNKEKQLNDAMKRLLQPEKKSDDDVALEAIISLMKGREEPNTQPSLSNLLKSLNSRPQSKTDGSDVERELRQLQKAINSLRPKEDNDLNNFGLENAIGGKDDAQQFQSMLNQLISQNGASASGLAGQPIISADGTKGYLGKQLLNPYNQVSNTNGYSNQLAALQGLIKTYGSSQYGNQPNYGAGPNDFSYTPNSNLYGPNSVPYSLSSNAYSALNGLSPSYGNSYGPSLNAYSSSLGGFGPNSYSSNSYSSVNAGPYSPNPNNYGSGSSLGHLTYSSASQGSGNGNQQIISNPYSSNAPLPYSDNNYQSSVPFSLSSVYPPSNINYPTSYPKPYASPNSYGPISYGSSYQPPKNPYQSSSYQPGSYSTHSQALSGYQTGLNSVNSGYSSAAGQSYGPGANSYSQNSGPDYRKQFFQSSGPAGGGYSGPNYGSKDFAGASLDQPYSVSQNSDQYKTNTISDLTQQIQNLENIIHGLNRGGDYSQSVDDKAAIYRLEQRIYELKGVINQLNQPPYSQTVYSPSQQLPQTSKPSYGQAYVQPSYGSQAIVTSYASSGQGQYQPSDSNGQHHGSYGQTSPSQPSQAPYVSPAIQYPTNVPPQPPSPPPYQASPPSQPSQSPTSYQSNTQETSHAVAPYLSPVGQSGDSATPYQAKESFGRGRQHVRRKNNKLSESDENRRRKKREVGGMGAPPMAVQPHTEGADMSVKLKQADGEGGQSQYDLGNDALTQIANTFKKYLEENLTQPENQVARNQPPPPMTNQQNRNSALDGLQQKLDALKIQLESQKSSARSLHEPLGEYQPPTYGGQNNYLPASYTSGGNYQVQKVIKSHHQDVFTAILLKILDKVIASLPHVLERIFGHVITGIGDSYGDYYSPLQNILNNLGAAGYLPLILVKVLETASAVFQHLKKNPFFKQFLLPAVVLALAAGGILFLIYFLQQDQPYGYIGYHGNSYQNNYYPQHEPNPYGNHYDSGTSPNYYGNYRDTSYYPKYRSNINENLYGNGNGRPDIYNNDIRRYSNPDYNTRFVGGNTGNYGNPQLQYSRGYYDHFQDNSEGSFGKDGYRIGSI